MKRYSGTRAVSGRVAVCVEDIDQGAPSNCRPLIHRVLHSPDGFEWGYGGSGPADLARSILWDALGEEPHPSCYHAFKFAHVARFPRESDWQLDELVISGWIDEWREMGNCATLSAHKDYSRRPPLGHPPLLGEARP